MPPHKPEEEPLPLLTDEQMGEIIKAGTEGAKGDDSDEPTEDDCDAAEKVNENAKGLVKKKEFNFMVAQGRRFYERHPWEIGKSAFDTTVNAVRKIGDLAKWLYDNSKEALTAALKATKEGPKNSEIMHGLLFNLCTIAAITAAVQKGLQYSKSVVTAAFQGVWKTIKEVTGFVWSVFVKLVKNPAFWGCVTAVGVGLAVFANPVAGACVSGVGLLGVALTK